MATTPFTNPTSVYSLIPSSVPFKRNMFNVSSKPFLSSSSLLMSGSFAIKCSKNNGNVNGNHCWSKKGKNMMYSVSARWFNELRKVKELEKFVSYLADPTGKAKKELDQVQIENKKMKQYINHLKVKVDEDDQLQTENKMMKEYIDHVIKTKVDRVRTENEKMTQYINYLKTKVDEIEICEKKVKEAQILLAELECSLQVIKQALRNEY